MDLTSLTQILTTLAGGVAGALESPWWLYALYVVITCHITLMCVTLFLHRSKAHLAVKFVAPVDHLFRFWLWLTTGMSTVEWVAVHRKHHAKVETEDDPHSPVNTSIWNVLLRGAELYRIETSNAKTIEKYAHDIPRDFLERHLYNGRFNRYGIVLLMIVNLALFGFIGATLWALQMACIPLLAAGVINGAGHYWGYRNFDTPDNSTNVVPWAIIIAGEELHNNHHAYPSSAKFSLKPWEFDLGWAYLVIMRFFGLVKINRLAPRPSFRHAEAELDNDTIRAIIRSRMHVTAGYTDRVLKPLLSEANQHNKKTSLLSSHQKKLLHETLKQIKSVLTSNQKVQQLETFDLSNFKDLQVGIQFRQRLNEVWETAYSNKEKLYRSMRQWCQDAEESGVQSLQQFAETLRGYRLSYNWH